MQHWVVLSTHCLLLSLRSIYKPFLILTLLPKLHLLVSLWFLYKYVKDAAEKGSSLNQVLVPMIQHSLRFTGSKHGNQVMILLNWLFEDEICFQALANDLEAILSRKEDRYVSLGWCTLAQSLIEFEVMMDKLVTRGVRCRYDALLKIFCTHLVAIVRDGSTVQGEFELPTRLSVAAADLILSLTEALTRTNSVFNCSDDKQKAAGTGERNLPITLLASTSTEKKVNKVSKSSDFTGMEMKLLLWDHLDNLIILVERLTATDSEMLKSGVLMLSSCWKHYGMLLHLEDHKFAQQFTELLEQYLPGIQSRFKGKNLQFYADNYAEESPRNKESGRETIIFFLNCLALLLGRLHGKQFETTIEEYGSRLSQAIISQLNSVDDEVIVSSLCIFKAVIFRTNSSLSKHSADIRQINALLPMLLHLLDERDSAAKAVIKLFAEYCSIIYHATYWILQDEQMVISTQASNLIPLIDPLFTFPALVCLIYSPHERVHSLASGTLIALLKNYKHNPDVICLLLDYLSKPSQNPDVCDATDGVEGAISFPGCLEIYVICVFLDKKALELHFARLG
ncbi:hypothetical protein RND71_007986 [Anisodus tanguticus]|uniref:Uncharacterized protein n=1 Tax=Anisodus tanguticus TaxID=243964 RepID=A0AAE1SNP8_9SOLA|nr:hypothetical protein RND71_007986 [Anisodus tanguticus]